MFYRREKERCWLAGELSRLRPPNSGQLSLSCSPSPPSSLISSVICSQTVFLRGGMMNILRGGGSRYVPDMRTFFRPLLNARKSSLHWTGQLFPFPPRNEVSGRWMHLPARGPRHYTSVPSFLAESSLASRGVN